MCVTVFAFFTYLLLTWRAHHMVNYSDSEAIVCCAAGRQGRHSSGPTRSGSGLSLQSACPVSQCIKCRERICACRVSVCAEPREARDLSRLRDGTRDTHTHSHSTIFCAFAGRTCTAPLSATGSPHMHSQQYTVRNTTSWVWELAASRARSLLYPQP